LRDEDARGCLWALASSLRVAYGATADAAFIRSEINGRQSRRMVLIAFFAADLIGATLWALWCEERSGAVVEGGWIAADTRMAQACGSLGMNRFVLLLLGALVEGSVLFLAGRNPWTFWSDALILPLWLIRLSLLDVFLWGMSPQMLLGDALWFSVMAVMCRVHSAALLILVACQVIALHLALYWRGEVGHASLTGFDFVRYGIYSVWMLVIMAGAYILDEQSRLHSFEQFMSLQEKNAVLAERLLRWKVIPAEPESCCASPLDPRPSAFRPDARTTADTMPQQHCVGVAPWGHIISEDTDAASSRSSSGQPAQGLECSPASAKGVRFDLPEATQGRRAVVPTRRPKAAPRGPLCGGSAGRPSLSLADVLE